MKKVVDILATVCMLVAAVGFFLLGGGRFLKMMSGAEPLGDGISFAEAKGKYVTYEAAYPVGSYEEEYYSGDSSRVSKLGYVLYDEARQTFLYVTVAQQDSGSLQTLLRKLDGHSPETVAKYNMEIKPVTIEGSLVPMEDASMIAHAQRALRDRDTDNEELAAVWDRIAADQKDWYMIEYGAVGGMETMDIWLCMLAAVLSLLIFIVRLIGLLAGGKKQEELSESFGNRYEQFFAMQRARIREWCEYMRYRNSRSIYLCVVCTTVILAAIGFLAGYSAGEVMVRHVPLGLFFGEIVSGLTWFAVKGKADWKKMMKKIRKNLEKTFPTAGQQDEFAQDYLDACREWGYEGKGKDSMTFGALGNRYWTLISGFGNVTVIEAGRVNRVSTYVDSERVAYGKYRGRVISYVAKFFMKDNGGMVYETNYLFPTEAAMDDFAQLLKRRVDGRIEVAEEGVKA